jgi:hypothetical protein
MRVHFRPEGVADLAEAYCWYERQRHGPELALPLLTDSGLIPGTWPGTARMFVPHNPVERRLA